MYFLSPVSHLFLAFTPHPKNQMTFTHRSRNLFRGVSAVPDAPITDGLGGGDLGERSSRTGCSRGQCHGSLADGYGGYGGLGVWVRWADQL